MFAHLWLFTIPAIIGQPKNRAEFARAMHAVQMGWSQAQVKQALGRPDDIWPVNDSLDYVEYGEERWCYGSKRHHDMPTLGYVIFREGKVLSWRYSDRPPSPKLIRDAELTDALSAIAPDAHGYDSRPNPAAEIRIANLLISKGKPKAIAILREFERVSSPSSLASVLAVAFTSPLDKPPPEDAPGAPFDFSNFPTAASHVRYKEFLMDGIPIDLCIFKDDWSGLASQNLIDPNPIGHYLDYHEADLTLRKKKIVPPEDPFLIYPSAAKLETGVTFLRNGSHSMGLNSLDGSSTSKYVLAQLLLLVSSAYRPFGDDEIPAKLTPTDFERFHREFLALHCHWDLARQMYVRSDGSFFKDPPDEHLQQSFHFDNVPQFDLTITLGRVRHEEVMYNVRFSEQEGPPIGDAVMTFEEPSSHKAIAWMGINGKRDWAPSASDYLGSPPHPPSAKDRMLSSSFRLPRNKDIQMKLELNGKSYFSPVFRP